MTIWRALDIGFLGRQHVSLVRICPCHQEHDLLTGVVASGTSCSKPWSSLMAFLFIPLFFVLLSLTINFFFFFFFKDQKQVPLASLYYCSLCSPTNSAVSLVNLCSLWLPCVVLIREILPSQEMFHSALDDSVVKNKAVVDYLLNNVKMGCVYLIM